MLMVNAAVVVLPLASVTASQRVQTRPSPLPFRSRRTCTDRQSGAITMSLRVFPLPGAFSASYLLGRRTTRRAQQRQQRAPAAYRRDAWQHVVER